MAKSISINDKTYDRLAKRGQYGVSMDDIISRLLDESEGGGKK